MPLLDPQTIIRELGSTGRTCTVTEISITFGSDEYRTKTESTTVNTDINCWVNVLSEEDDLVKEGNARAGDLIFWFDSDNESLCVQGNKITLDSTTFQISDVHKFNTAGVVQVIECRVRKI